MILKTVQILGVTLLLASLVPVMEARGAEPQQGQETAEIKKEKHLPEVYLADLIHMATALSGRKTMLEKGTATILGISRIEKRFTAVSENVRNYEFQLYKQNFSGNSRHSKLTRTRSILLSERYYLQRTVEPVNDKIQQLKTSKKTWLSDQKFWRERLSILSGEDEPEEILSIVEEALTTIENALEIISTRLEPWLALQVRGAQIESTIDGLITDIDAQILIKGRNILAASFPSLFDAEYYTQFNEELLNEARKGLRQLSWSGGEFFARNGWSIALQGFLVLFLIFAIIKKRRRFEKSEGQRFLAERPFSAGLFMGVAPFYMVHEVGPPLWVLALSVIIGISFTRMVALLTASSREKRFFYGIILLFIAMRFLYEIDLPQALSRLFVLLSALIGFLLCISWKLEKTGRAKAVPYAWVLPLTMVVFVVVMVAEIGGKAALAEYLLAVTIRIMTIIMAFFLLKNLARAVLEAIVKASMFQRFSLVRNHTDAIIRRVAIITDGLIFVLSLSSVLVILWVYDSRWEAAKAFYSFSFTVGSWQLSVGLIISALALFYGALLTSWIIQKVIMESTWGPYKFEAGFRYSLARLVHYAIVFIGFLLAISMLGFEMTKLTIMVSALGVGIGFGLQGVVSNFVCGIIMLFERPLRVGDYIEFDNQNARIKSIGLRASKVQRVDRAEIVVPNSTLINNPITNWTLTDRISRLSLTVGVAYGSDIPLVHETLLACAADHDWVLKRPEPKSYFREFGDSTLKFELHVFISNFRDRRQAESDLNQEIDRRFRMAGIEIAFPQRDLHVRSVDPSIDSRPLEPLG